MIQKISILVAFLILVNLGAIAQENKWGFGFYGDMQVKSPDYLGVFGIQGIYDFEGHHGVQAQVYGRKDYVSVGADYLLSFLDKGDHNFNVFVGVGGAQDFYRYDIFDPDNGETTVIDQKANMTMFNGQIGLSYYFADIGISVYGGYKVRAEYNFDRVDANHVMLGVRYHPW